ncbi:MAG: PorV/PorQ family protein [Candidatus Zixiibacteriota bacterium]
MKRLIQIAFVCALAGGVSADFSKVGSAGAQFLKIGVGSRYQGMGEASVAIANDVYSMYWNPAGLVEINNSAIGFTNVNWVLDIDLNYVAYAKNFQDIGVFGVAASILSMDKQEITTFDQQDGTGNQYSASSYAIGVSFARQMTAKFAFGASIKYIGERIHQERSEGLGFDFGTMLYTGFRSLRMGMSMTNLGRDMRFEGPDLDVTFDPQQGQGANSAIGAKLKSTPYDLPLMFRFGLAYDFNLAPKSMLTLSGELKHPNDNVRQEAVGAEFGYNQQFFLRTGYKFNNDEQTIAFGGGLQTNITKGTKLTIDYAWQDFGRLQTAQRFSVGFVF